MFLLVRTWNIIYSWYFWYLFRDFYRDNDKELLIGNDYTFIKVKKKNKRIKEFNILCNRTKLILSRFTIGLKIYLSIIFLKLTKLINSVIFFRKIVIHVINYDLIYLNYDLNVKIR